MTNTRRRLLRSIGVYALPLALAIAAAGVHAQQQDFSKVEIKTTKLSANFYTLEGQGGMIGVLAGPGADANVAKRAGARLLAGGPLEAAAELSALPRSHPDAVRSAGRG